MTTVDPRPHRSLSYNDLKKRRLLRQSKSKTKITKSRQTQAIPLTEKKHLHLINSTSQYDAFENERPNQLQMIKKKLIIKKTHEATKKKQYPLQMPNHTERIQPRKKMRQLKEISRETSIQDGFNSKDVVRGLIQQSKSSRKILKFSELRDKVKASKERSKSKSVNHSKSIKIFIDLKKSPQKPSNYSPLKGVKHSLRIKKFESVAELPSTKKSNRSLVIKSPLREKDFISVKSSDILKFKSKRRQSQTVENIGTIQQNLESSIQIQRQSEVFDENQKKFYEELCEMKRYQRGESGNKEMKIKEKARTQRVGEKQKVKKVKGNKKSEQNDNILDLLDVETSELKRLLGHKYREKKRKNDLEKLNKKFPKDFFKF